MEKDLNNSAMQNSLGLKENDTDKSFVGKFKSHVSGIINNTPLSKWFRKQDEISPSVVRLRDDDDEEIYEMQPPTKRPKLPVESNDVTVDDFTKIEFREPPNTPKLSKSSVNSVAPKRATFNSFPEPVAGPSGIKSRKMLKRSATGGCVSSSGSFGGAKVAELSNGHKDSDSEESTSGYSSVARIGSKEQVCESRSSSKQTSPLEASPTNSRSLFHTTSASMDRSLFADRSLSPNLNSSLSSRRPSFNASTFGSPNFVDRTLSTKRIINSPFYNGRTIYGGASAYGRRLGRNALDLQTNLRNSVQIKPVNKPIADFSGSGNLALGKTARRILDTLEQYSSPVNDAKKIPVPPKKLRTEGLLTRYTGANPYLVREAKAGSNKELQLPSVSDLLKIKQRERLQDSTESVRQIATSSKSSLNSDTYKIPTAESKPKHTGKVKSKVTSVRQRAPIVKRIEEVPLVAVSLPITSLPKLDFKIAPPASATSSGKVKNVKNPAALIKEAAKKSPSTVKEGKGKSGNVMEFKFSDPLVIAENLKSIIAVNNFKFSEPVCKKSKVSEAKLLNFKMPDEYQLPKLEAKPKNNGAVPKAAPALKLTGSVMDILGTWECSTCLIRNSNDKVKCAACESKRVNPAPKNKTLEAKNGFGQQFAKSGSQWDCEACMVRNSGNASACVACTTPKVGVAKLKESVTTPFVPLRDVFKVEGGWECTTCLVRNKREMLKCQACEMPKPSGETAPLVEKISGNGFGGKFKPPPSTWECGVCMIRNNEDLDKCAACTSARPGGGGKKALISASLEKSSFSSDFKIKDTEWECNVCLVRNQSCSNKCQCCETLKPGSGNANSSKLQALNDTKPLSAINFGIDKATAQNFSFGIPSSAAAVPAVALATPAASIFGEAAEKPAAPASFTFGAPAAKVTAEIKPSAVIVSEKEEKKTTVVVEKKEQPIIKTQAPQFKFGAGTTPTTLATSVSSAPTATVVAPVVNKPAVVAPISAASTTKDTPTFNFKPTPDVNGGLKNFFTPPKTDFASNVITSPPTKNNLFSFGAKSSVSAPAPIGQANVASPTFGFGSNKSNATPTSTTVFGAASKSAAPINNGFGGGSSFGTPSNAFSSAGAKPFDFSSNSGGGEASNKNTSMFSFGQPAKVAPPSFDFGSSSGFNFAAGGGGKSVGAVAPPPVASNLFGAAVAVANTNAANAKNGTFNFGSGSVATNNNSQKAGFSFGSAAANSQPTFGFGGGSTAAPAPSTGGFNFTGAPPTFDVAAKPSFNFSDGNVTAFSAQPVADGGPQRKIKRAIRRSQR